MRATYCRKGAKGYSEGVAGDEVFPERGREGCGGEGEGEVHLGGQRWILMARDGGEEE